MSWSSWSYSPDISLGRPHDGGQGFHGGGPAPEYECAAPSSHPARLVDRLLSEQLQDGGWNGDAPPSKRSSFNSTICVLEGLLEYEKANGAAGAVKDARLRGQEYLLERKLFRSLSTGNVIDRDRKSDLDWREFSFPTRWHYDVLWGLDYLRRTGAGPDERTAEAVDESRAPAAADFALQRCP